MSTLDLLVPSNLGPDEQTAIRALSQQADAASTHPPSPERAQAEKDAEACDVARTLATVRKPAKPDADDGAIDADKVLNSWHTH